MSDVRTLLADLISIDSVNPSLVPGAVGEGRIAAFIADWLHSRGLEVHVQEVLPGRSNVIGIARGAGGGKSLMLNGHIDTVGVEGMSGPFSPRIEGGRMYGRGAYDMKGGVAACMVAAARAQEMRLSGDVIFAGVMDEEYAGMGTSALVQDFRADAAIVAEPTEMQLVTAHKGYVWIEVETEGVAAHGSRPHLGVDAIVKMGHFLTELEKLDQRLQSGAKHPLLGTGSVHASLIVGGQELSSYPQRCKLSIERRTLPGEACSQVVGEVAEILGRLSASDPSFKATQRLAMERTPLDVSPDSAMVIALGGAAEAVLGEPRRPSGVSFWTDAATLQSAGIPTVLFGPMGEGAHAAEEWVDLESVERCAEVYLRTAETFCGMGRRLG